jgi:hypothetical protein
LRVDRKYVRTLGDAQQLGVSNKMDRVLLGPKSGTTAAVFLLDVRAPAEPQRTYLPEPILKVTDGKGVALDFELNFAPDPASAGAAFRAVNVLPAAFDPSGLKAEGAVWAVDRTVMEFAFERDSLKEGGVAKWNGRRAILAAISDEGAFQAEVHIIGPIDGLGREKSREPLVSRLRGEAKKAPEKKKEPYVIGKAGETTWELRDGKGKLVPKQGQGGGSRRSGSDEVRYTFHVAAADKAKVSKLVLRIPILTNPTRIPFVFSGFDLPAPTPTPKKSKRAG